MRLAAFSPASCACGTACVCRPRDPNKILAFSTDCVNHVVEAYTPIVKRHMNDSFTQEEKEWQQMRRGR